MQNRAATAVVGSKELANELSELELEAFQVASVRSLAKRKLKVAPRLILVEAEDLGQPGLAETVREIRSTLPMTDVLVWIPRGSGTLVREAFLAGAKDVVTHRSLPKLAEVANQIISDQQFLPKVHDLARQRMRSSKFESMLSRSEVMWDLFEQCSRVAPADATVLIVGETGTGKELLARAIHRRAHREGRFVACNCGSISEQLIESELFGHVQGAFTGAQREKKGLVRHADKGTLFLDEIGDMPENVQVNLLRLLQEKKVRPVGGHEEIPVNVRVVAATNVPLDDAVAQGGFREDLFYRLDVIRLNVPPLRERPEDIVFLFGYFLRKLKSHYGLDGPVLSDGFVDALAGFDWPGNVRQLQNFAERIVLSGSQSTLTDRDFSRMMLAIPQSATATDTRLNSEDSDLRIAVDPAKTLDENVAPIIAELEHRYLRAVLSLKSGRISETASHAAISRRTLLRKLTAFQIDKAEYK